MLVRSHRDHVRFPVWVLICSGSCNTVLLHRAEADARSFSRHFAQVLHRLRLSGQKIQRGEMSSLLKARSKRVEMAMAGSRAVRNQQNGLRDRPRR